MKAPITFKYFEKIVNVLKSDEEYLNELHKLGMDCFEFLNSQSQLSNLVDIMFTPLNDWENRENYDLFSWWCWETEFGKRKDMAKFWVTNKDDIEEEHVVDTIEAIYNELCIQFNCGEIIECE